MTDSNFDNGFEKVPAAGEFVTGAGAAGLHVDELRGAAMSETQSSQASKTEKGSRKRNLLFCCVLSDTDKLQQYLCVLSSSRLALESRMALLEFHYFVWKVGYRFRDTKWLLLRRVVKYRVKAGKSPLPGGRLQCVIPYGM